MLFCHSLRVTFPGFGVCESINGRIACLRKPGYALFFFLIYILHHELDSFQTFKDFMGEISDDINDFFKYDDESAFRRSVYQLTITYNSYTDSYTTGQ